MKDILIVEDVRPERERLVELFTKAGYGVVACDSAGSAESALKHNEFRLAIVDIGLGDKSGSLLFNTLKGQKQAPFIIIFTGNPSVHLKQRFLDQGAVDYVVKGSSQAQNDNFLARIKEVLGEDQREQAYGIALEEFLNRFVPPTSAKLFMDMNNKFPPCVACGSTQYQVIFSHAPQMPPEIVGKVVCTSCGKEMDSAVG